jgi:hypothetical protein
MNRPPITLIKRDDNARHGVPADELAGTVHGAEEVGLLRDLFAAPLGFALVDDAGVQVRVDGHLPPRHPVQGESGRHFADPRGPLGDHHELDHHDDHEQDGPHHELVARHEFAERLDHAPRPLAACPPPPRVRISRVVATFSTSRTSVVANSSDGKMLNSSGVRHVDGRQQHHHRQRDVGCQQHRSITAAGKRDDDHQHAGNQQQRQDQVLCPPRGKGSVRAGQNARSHPCLRKSAKDQPERLAEQSKMIV